MGETSSSWLPPPRPKPGGYAGALFDYHRAHPEALRLLLWEALELGEDPVPEE
ncbi:hypothetical protein [Nocardia tenerifensis]|uniref:hypothetical protein n=1 Tax=Nocardia tenerifensis TaxID=228006 RepID=UPI0014615209|nr:hypothetical protein [Nocardia tenerifensis]